MSATINNIDINSATAIVRNYFQKSVFGDKKLLDKDIINFLDFRIISAKQTPSQDYEIMSELSKDVFLFEKEKYKILVGNTGSILSVERIEKEEK